MKGVRYGVCEGCGGEKLFSGRPAKCGACGGKVIVERGPSKYRNQVAEEGGIKFASKREARRWGELKLLAASGRITKLRRQVPYELHVLGGATLCKYIADFVYSEEGQEVVEDCKGFRTREYRLKKKWMRLEHGITIRET